MWNELCCLKGRKIHQESCNLLYLYFKEHSNVPSSKCNAFLQNASSSVIQYQRTDLKKWLFNSYIWFWCIFAPVALRGLKVSLCTVPSPLPSGPTIPYSYSHATPTPEWQQHHLIIVIILKLASMVIKSEVCEDLLSPTAICEFAMMLLV